MPVIRENQKQDYYEYYWEFKIYFALNDSETALYHTSG